MGMLWLSNFDSTILGPLWIAVWSSETLPDGVSREFVRIHFIIRVYAKDAAPDAICTGVPPAQSRQPSRLPHPFKFHILEFISIRRKLFTSHPAPTPVDVCCEVDTAKKGYSGICELAMYNYFNEH
jgi:hypothetical protein